MCKAAAFLQAVVILTNSTTLITIAVDRYISIVYPHRPTPWLAWRKWHVSVFLCGLLLLSCGEHITNIMLLIHLVMYLFSSFPLTCLTLAGCV